MNPRVAKIKTLLTSRRLLHDVVDLIKVRALHRRLAAYALEREAGALQQSHGYFSCLETHLANSLLPGASPRTTGPDGLACGMPDYGRDLTFGYFLIPNANDPLLEVARDIEIRGLDWIGIQDHPYQRRFVDTWSLLGAIAAVTTRVGFFPDVANLPLRPPAVMGKAAASLDVLSGGRFELALGAGSFWDAIAAYGGPRREPRDALAALEEAIQVIRLIWSGDRNLRFEGAHYRLAGAHSGPVPVHPIGIWLGVYGSRALRLAGRLADGWVPSLRGETTFLSEGAARIDDAATNAGRDPADIRRVLNVNGQITDGPRGGLLRGPVDQWVDELTDLAVGYGFDTFMFWGDGEDQLPRFAEEVVPAVRAQVAAERGRSS